LASTSTARHGNGSIHATSAEESINSEQEDDNSDDVEDDNDDVGHGNGTAPLDEDLAKTAKYLKLYFSSLAKSGTVRTVEEEFTLVTAKLTQVFKCQKFITSDRDLSGEGIIAQIMFQEMDVPKKFQDVWWEEMKLHVRKKMDERQSNCGTSIKKGILGK